MGGTISRENDLTEDFNRTVRAVNSNCDPQEKEYKHSLYCAVAHLEFEDKVLNFLDTPGSASWMGRTLAVLPAVETLGVVVDATSGVDATTRRMMERARENELSCFVIVNKIDDDNADLEALTKDIQEQCGRECLPINLLSSDASDVVDCFWEEEGDVDFSSVKEAHSALLEQIVELDADLMERYLEGEAVLPEQLVAPCVEALKEHHLIPTCYTSARTGAGIQELLRFIAKLGPNPAQARPHPFVKVGEDSEETPVEVTADENQPVVGHVFRVTVDPFLGVLSVFRLHQGTITKDSKLYVGKGGKPIKIGQIFRLNSKEYTDIDRAIPGYICAVSKADELALGTIIHDNPEESSDLILKHSVFPAPMCCLAVTAKTRSDEQKLGTALRKLEIEDPCLLVEHNSQNHETTLRGLTENHLRLALEKMSKQYNVEVETSVPSISYRETVQAPAEGHHRHKKQTGGSGQFGEVFLRIEPLERGAGFEFESKISGGVIPSQYNPAIEKGGLEALNEGAIAGYPMQDIKAVVYDGKYHAVDSKEIAFFSAGKKAFLDAVSKGTPVVLEPIVTVEVLVPEQYMGDITGDLASKRGQIRGTELNGGAMMKVQGELSLSELINYTAEIKFMTSGQGSYTMEFSQYEVVPSMVQSKLMEDYGKPASESH